MRHLRPAVNRLLAVLGFFTAAQALADDLPPQIEFNRDIRPILSETCFQCHGPDAAQRKADLRLDLEKDAFAERDGRRALVPGDLKQSELIQRITSDDAGLRMPPPESGKQLTSRQVELFKRWVSQGAKWQKHWSLIPVVRPAVPAANDREWVRNGIDAFVLDRLDREGLRPAPESDRVSLLRRVTFDLTGLPPAPDEVDAFLADDSPVAYERVVERLLATPRFGERLAARWLDYARYADTNGYQSDGERHMWRWRDWVIDAFNSNMPFDRFTVEQLAGDLLPEPTLEQRIATGFNRNHRGNAEGGIIPEEYAVEYVVDRIETTSTVWLGLTLGCCRCHSHKYDPFTQKDFYRLFAYFNNVPEKGRAVKFGNSPPMIPAPTREQQSQLAALDRRVQEAEARVRRVDEKLADLQAAWEPTLGEGLDWNLTEGLVAQFDLDADVANRVAVPAAFVRTATYLAGGGGAPPVTKPEPPKPAAFEEGEPAFVSGRLGQAAAFDGKRFIRAGDFAAFGYYDKFSVAAWIRARSPEGTIVSRMTDKPEADGWSVQLAGGRVQVNLVKRWLDDSLRVETEQPVSPDQWQHVAVTYDGSREASGVRVYIDSVPQKLVVRLDELNQDFASNEPLRIGGGGGPGGRFQGLIDDVRIYAGQLSSDDVAILATSEPVSELVKSAPTHRSLGKTLKVRECFIDRFAPDAIREAHRELRLARLERERFIESLPTVMIMEELPTPRPAYLLVRGEYDKHGDQVERGVPATLPPLPAGAPANRLGLAQWLVDPRHPLTARVTVNRLWQLTFGAGLVRTLEDFGSQGDWPSHPELLDWLSSEFVESGWDVKSLVRTIVTSATYRQTSKVPPAFVQRDPENRLLARGPRVRLSAEAIRDQALSVSGLLVERLGGPSVMPYQPEGLWKDLATLTEYPQSHGPDLYRRSLYTYWKRTVSPPEMMTFDASARETCVVRETRTNTPLQALALLNDVIFIESARNLAERIMQEAGPNPRDRLSRAFRICTSRAPSSMELAILEQGLAGHLARFQADRAAAQRLTSIGESPVSAGRDVPELAAYTAVMNLLLNLDETITRP